MKKLLTHPWFTFALRVILGGLFIYAGVLKFLDLLAFADSIATYQFIPDSLIGPIALMLPPLEIAAGLMLIIGFHTRLASFSIGVLCLVFLIALGQAAFRGLEVDCGCFGDAMHASVFTAIVRDVIFLAIAVWVYWITALSLVPKPQK